MPVTYAYVSIVYRINRKDVRIVIVFIDRMIASWAHKSLTGNQELSLCDRVSPPIYYFKICVCLIYYF